MVFKRKLQVSDDNSSRDGIEQSIGTLGHWQLMVSLSLFLCKLPVAWQQLSIIFIAPPIEFTCEDLTINKCSLNCSKHIFNRSIFTETITTEWELICDREFLNSITQSISMFGILIGSFVFGYFSDKIGRRIPFIFAVVLQLFTGLAVAFIKWFWLFLIMRFLLSAATGGTMVISFVLIMELNSTKWRTIIGILYHIPFNIGIQLMALFGYYLRDWRDFQIAISLPSLILLLYFWILPESPRWLLTIGKTDEAIIIIKNVAQFNKLPINSINDNINAYIKKKNFSCCQKMGTILDLIRTPRMRLYTICICFNWLVCGLCFYGVNQYIGHLGGNIFINVAISGLMQLPGCLLPIWTTKIFGRKLTLIISNILSGVTCLTIAFMPDQPMWVKPVISCFGILWFTSSFITVYIYTGELFPTIIRNLGVGTSSMCARIGSMIAPFIVTLSLNNYLLPPLIFGGLPLIAAIICYLLPETLNKSLPDSIDEVENFENSTINTINQKLNIKY